MLVAVVLSRASEGAAMLQDLSPGSPAAAVESPGGTPGRPERGAGRCWRSRHRPGGAAASRLPAWLGGGILGPWRSWPLPGGGRGLGRSRAAVGTLLSVWAALRGRPRREDCSPPPRYSAPRSCGSLLFERRPALLPGGSLRVPKPSSPGAVFLGAPLLLAPNRGWHEDSCPVGRSTEQGSRPLSPTGAVPLVLCPFPCH